MSPHGWYGIYDFLNHRVAESLAEAKTNGDEKALAHARQDLWLLLTHEAENNADPETEPGENYWSDCQVCLVDPPCDYLRRVAMHYVDHPDFYPAWRI